MNIRFAATWLLVAATGACQMTSPDLEPLDANDVELHAGRAVTSDGKIELSAEYNRWPGPVRITEDVTPIRITVENRSARAIVIRYERFALQGDSGATYIALPPYEIDGTALLKSRRPLPKGGIQHRAFSVYAPYHVAYPYLDPYGGPYYDHHRYSQNYAHWPRQDLPSDAMLERALPEGVIASGGQVGGYLYFQRVDDDEPRVVLETDLYAVDDTARPAAALEVLFDVHD